MATVVHVFNVPVERRHVKNVRHMYCRFLNADLYFRNPVFWRRASVNDLVLAPDGPPLTSRCPTSLRVP
jgi:hypothetical protein